MAHAEIHVLGSVQGYTTVARSSGVTADECRELETLSFGDATSAEARARLRTHAVMNGRRLRTGRFAISRMLPGGTDDAGRPTVEVVTLLVPDAAYRSAVRSLGFLADDAGFWTQARSSAQSGVDVPDRPTPAGPVDQAVLRAFDLWFSAVRSGAQAVLPESESVTIARLLAHLDPRDLAACRWGIGLLSLSTPADILTYAPGTSLVGARTVLKAAAAGQWHAAEMEHCVYLVEQTRRLPASDSLAVTRTEPSDAYEHTVDHPIAVRGRKSGVGKLRIASIGSVAVATIALVVAIFVHKGSSTPRPAAEESLPATKSGSNGVKDAGGGSEASSTGSSSGGTYGQKPAIPAPQPAPAAPAESAPAGPAPSEPGAGVSPFGGGSPGKGDGGTAGAGSVPSPSPTQPSSPTEPTAQPPPPPDSDADGVPDDRDPCPENPEVPKDKDLSVDTDADGVPDGCDNCPERPNGKGPDGKQPDDDGDGVGDACDNCPGWKTANIVDSDKDGIGDDCECTQEAVNDPQARGQKGKDCDENGKPLGTVESLPSSKPLFEKVTFAKSSDAIAAIDRTMVAWKNSTDSSKGSVGECEMIREALCTLSGAIALLADELVIGGDEIRNAKKRFVESGSKVDQRPLVLHVIKARDESISLLVSACQRLLNESGMLRRCPESCVEGNPIVDSGLAGASGRLEAAANKFRGGFKVQGDSKKMPKDYLKSLYLAVGAAGNRWGKFRDDAISDVVPSSGYKPSQ